MTDLDKKIEFKGYWYLPSNPDNAIAGVVTYFPNERIILELFGGFDNSITGLFFSDKDEPIIYGKTSDAKEVSLVNCFQYSSLNFSADFPIVRYNCDYMIIGKHINGLDEKCKYWANIEIPELSFWCPPKAIEIKETINKIELSISRFQNNDTNTIENVQIDENTSICIKQSVNFDSSEYLLTPKIEQYTFLEIYKKEDATILDFLSDILMYEQFLSLATLKRVKCSKITIYDKHIYQENKSEKFYKPIDIIHPFPERASIKQEKIRHFQFLFDYSAIKGIYSIILKKWYNEPSDIIPIRCHLIDSLEQKSIYGSVDFLNIIQAIEGFWWRFRDDAYRQVNNTKTTQLNTIINELIMEFDRIVLLKECGINIDSSVDSRHYYSHFFKKSKKQHTLYGWELIKEAKKLRILLLCCVLSYIGFDNERINNVLDNCSSHLLK